MADLPLAQAPAAITSVADSTGTILAINRYDEYGIPASTNLGRFGYTGQTWLPEITMWHYRARIYSPTLGRFLQTDPIGYGDGLNMYAYVGGDPVNYVDPLGLRRVCGLVEGFEGCWEVEDGRPSPNISFRGTNDDFGWGFGGGGGAVQAAEIQSVISRERLRGACRTIVEGGATPDVVGSVITDLAIEGALASVGGGIGEAIREFRRQRHLRSNVVRSGAGAGARAGVRGGVVGAIAGAAIGSIIDYYYGDQIRESIDELTDRICSAAGL